MQKVKGQRFMGIGALLLSVINIDFRFSLV